LKVIGGIAKGRNLKTSRDSSLRPTRDKVKEALFDIIGDLAEDSIFLDLYAGTGGIGIEALSRGAKEVVFVDSSSKSIRLIRDNLAIIGLEDKATIYKNDVLKAIKILCKHQRKFDIIFLDPPYHKGMVDRTLEWLDKYNILAEGGLIIAEYSLREEIPERVEKIRLDRVKEYGNTRLAFYRKLA